MAQKKQGKKPNPIAAFFGFGITASKVAPSRPAGRVSAPGQATQPRPMEYSRTREQPRSTESDILETPVPARTFSWAHIFLLGALIFCVLQVYNPLTTYIRQSNEIASVQQNIADLEAEKTELQAQISWWEDDNYVKQQARSRLFYVQPGETPYLVVGADATSSMADDTSAAAKTAPEDSWTTKLWSSVQLSAELPEAETIAEEAESEATADSTATETGSVEPDATDPATADTTGTVPNTAPASGGQ